MNPHRCRRSSGSAVAPPATYSDRVDALPFDASDGRTATGPGSERSTAAGPLSIEAVVTATAADVWRLHAHLVSPAQADDLSQETFLRVLRALPTYRGESSVKTWVLAIASRTAVDEIRRGQRQRRLLARLSPRPEAARDPTAGHDLMDLLARLEARRRQAFVLTQVLELDYAEAAQLAGCPVGTIRSRVSRARADLIAALAARGD